MTKTFTNYFARAGPLATMVLAAAMMLPGGSVPASLLRSPSTSISASQKKTAMKNYGTFEFYPCVWNDNEGYVLFVEAKGWRKMPVPEIKMTAAPMSEADFKAAFPNLPPAPIA